MMRATLLAVALWVLLVIALWALLADAAMAQHGRNFPSNDRTQDWRMLPVPHQWHGQWYKPGQGPCWNWFQRLGGWRWVC